MGGGQRTTTTYVRKGRHGIKGLAALGVSGKWCASAPLPLGWEFTRQLVDGGQSAAAQSQRVEPIGETLRISQVPVPGRSSFSLSVRRGRDPSRGKNDHACRGRKSVDNAGGKQLRILFSVIYFVFISALPFYGSRGGCASS